MLKELELTTKYNALRDFDQMYVEVIVQDSGLQQTYTGKLSFRGAPDTVMIDTDEILIECITGCRVVPE